MKKLPYAVLKEDDNCYHVKNMSDNTTFAVAKAGLSPDAHARIKKLAAVKQYAEGGQVMESDPSGEDSVFAVPTETAPVAQPSVLDNFTTSAQNFKELVAPLWRGPNPDAKLADFVQPVMAKYAPASPAPAPAAQPGVAVAPIAETVAPAPADMPVIPAALPPSAEPQAQVPKPGVSGLDQMAQAARTEARALQDQATADTEAMKAFQVKQEQDRVKYEADYNAAQASADTLAKEIREFKIKPNSVWTDGSTGQKIGASIAMILSGIGSAMAGQQNMAEKVIKDAIDRDIKIQESQLETKKSLLSENYRKLGDMRAARAQTANESLASLQAQLQMHASKARGPQAQANLQRALGVIQVERDKLAAASAQALRRVTALRDGIPVGEEAPEDILDPEMAKRRVEYNGMVYRANDGEAAKKANEFIGSVKASNQGIDELLALSNKRGSSLSLTDRARAQTLATTLMGSLRKTLVGEGAVNESEWKLLKSVVKDPTALWSLKSVNDARLNSLKERVNAQTSANLSTLVPGLGKNQIKSTKGFK